MKQKEQENHIKALTTTFGTRDKTKTRYFFSVLVVLEGAQNDDGIPIVERATGAEIFKESIESALSFHPTKIIVVDLKNKNEIPAKATKYIINLEEESNTAKAPPEGNSLGAITEKYRHEGEILKWKTEQQIKEMKHQQKLDDLQKKLDELKEKLGKDKKLIEDLEQANKEWEKEYDLLKENRFKLKGVEVTEVLGNVLAKGVTGFIRQNSKGVSQLTGLPEQALIQAINTSPQEESVSNISENDNPEMEPVIAHLKEVLKMIDPKYLESFIGIITRFAHDNSLIIKVNNDLEKL